MQILTAALRSYFRPGRAVSEISHPTVQSTIDFDKLNKRFNEKKEGAAAT